MTLPFGFVHNIYPQEHIMPLLKSLFDSSCERWRKYFTFISLFLALILYSIYIYMYGSNIAYSTSVHINNIYTDLFTTHCYCLFLQNPAVFLKTSCRVSIYMYTSVYFNYMINSYQCTYDSGNVLFSSSVSKKKSSFRDC